jgi:hypothetical protein
MNEYIGLMLLIYNLVAIPLLAINLYLNYCSYRLHKDTKIHEQIHISFQKKLEEQQQIIRYLEGKNVELSKVRIDNSNNG